MKLITDEGERDITVPYENVYRAEVAHFSGCVERNELPDPRGEDGIYNMRLLKAIYEAAESSRSVSL